MNAGQPGEPGLEARLRRLFGGLDARAGFEERVLQRVAQLARAPRADLRAQFERRRALLRRSLRREAWTNAATLAGLGACAAVLLWRHAPAIARLAEGFAVPADAPLLAGVTLAVLGALVWMLLKRAPGARG